MHPCFNPYTLGSERNEVQHFFANIGSTWFHIPILCSLPHPGRLHLDDARAFVEESRDLSFDFVWLEPVRPWGMSGARVGFSGWMGNQVGVFEHGLYYIPQKGDSRFLTGTLWI